MCLSPKARYVMTRSIAVSLAAIFTGLVACDAVRAGDMLPPHVASQMGLTQAWRRYVSVPAGSQSIVDQKIFVHQENPHEFLEISVPVQTSPASAQPSPGATAGDNSAAADSDKPATRVLVRIPTNRIGSDGLAIGKKEAERLANNEIRRLKRRGYDATISFRTVPRINLYTLANDGTLECRDAETGVPIWRTNVGSRKLMYGAIGVSEEYVSVVNGSNLIQVDISTGEAIHEVTMTGSPLHGAINVGDYAMVPVIRNGVEGYPMRDPTLDPFTEVVSGIALALPTKSPDSARVAWGTSRGFVYVMEMAGTPSVLFRLNTDGIVSGRIASAPGDRFFFGSEAGQVYCVEATRTGKVIWSRPFAEPFYNGPMVEGDQLLIRSTYGNLRSLSLADGQETWASSSPNVDTLLGVVGGHIFVRTLSGSLAVLDLETGKRTAFFGEVQPDRILANTLTDRLYLVSGSGAVQCLRPEGADLPSFSHQPVAAAPGDDNPADPADKPGSTPFDPAGNDPLKPGDAADPFGGGADPFGAQGGDMADPFGADPFGN